MKLRDFINVVVPYIPAFLSGLICIGLIYGLDNFLPEAYRTLDNLRFILLLIAFISVLLVFMFIAFIFTKANQQRSTGTNLNVEIKSLTDKVHHFRNIVDILVRSKVWNPGLKEYIDEEFGDLNFFQMKEFYKGRSKLAIEFIEENNRFGETENLYLESKSLLLEKPTDSKVSSFSNPKNYDKAILAKWVAHKCGSGLWYFFGYKYPSFKDELDVNRIYERHQEKILSYAIQLDTQRYQDMGFSEELLSKLGEQMSEDVIPRLYALTTQAHKKLPNIVNIAFVLMLILTIFGIFQPIATLLFQLPPIFSFVSIAVVMSMLLFMVLAIYPFVMKEVNRK
jgi:hypothetical protein